MASMSPAEFKIFARNDQYTFMHRAFRELNPRSSFLHNWHNELIVSKLEACRRGEITRLIINVPPRSLKSHAAAVAFPAFVLGHNPSAQIICASYGQDLANKHSSDCRTVMTSEWYGSLFPTRLTPQKQSVQEFVTSQNGFRLATSVDSTSQALDWAKQNTHTYPLPEYHRRLELRYRLGLPDDYRFVQCDEDEPILAIQDGTGHTIVWTEHGWVGYRMKTNEDES